METITTWVNTHGFIVAFLGWGLACIISLAPKVKDPEKLSYFTRWAYNIMQFVGASLDKMNLEPAFPKVPIATLTTLEISGPKPQ